MSIYCNVILKPSATPEQLSALGAALWQWCIRTAGGANIYQYLDNQALADLIAGRLPAPDQTTWPAKRWAVHFGVRDGAFPDDQTAIDSLRHDLPAAGVEDVMAKSLGRRAVESSPLAFPVPHP